MKLSDSMGLVCARFVVLFAGMVVALPVRAELGVVSAERADRSGGDAHLSGHIDLSKAELVDGRYRVRLPRAVGRVAILTLDPAVQRAAERALARAKAPLGAVVVMGADGRILALAGRDATGDAARPDFGLPVQTWAPAASVFKVVTAAALVEAGVSSDDRVCYHGGVRSVQRSNLRDSRARDRTCNDLGFGVARSQNAVIAKLAHRHLNRDGLARTAEAFGFGRAPAFALAADPASVELPDDALGFARVAAGFWHTELSALSGALLANVVATGGMWVPPRIVERVVTDGDERIIGPAAAHRVLADEVARAVGEMMVGTTESGSARRGFHDLRGNRFLPRVRVAGKTGTLSRTSPSYLQYSWFVGFAPADRPQVSIAVLLGNPPKWHLKAHTAARMVLQAAL